MRQDGTLSASEISEYTFCSVAWYMDKNGYPRNGGSSKRIEYGKKMHRKLEPRYRRAGIAAKISTAAVVLLAVVIIAVAMGWF